MSKATNHKGKMSHSKKNKPRENYWKHGKSSGPESK